MVVAFLANSDATECPLMEKLCNVSTHNTTEECFLQALLYYLIFISEEIGRVANS